jgi:acyl dehydratase
MTPDIAIPDIEQLEALIGHRFPGGAYRVAHWENWLLTDCTGRSPLPDALVHPIVLFHAPILGAGTSIGELFRLGGASGASGSVGLLGYDWEYLQPIREDVEYRVTGGIVAAERHSSPSGAIADRVAFQIELHEHDRPDETGALVARVTNRWQFRRTTTHLPPVRADTLPPATGALIPTWEMPAVDAARMKTMAALLRDPYPVHWDRSSNEALGLGGRVINQGPLNLSYVANMLMEWAGPAAIRRLTVSFGRPVLDGDRVIAGGQVRSVVDGVATCDVWLRRDDEQVVTGTAEVMAPPA